MKPRRSPPFPARATLIALGFLLAQPALAEVVPITVVERGANRLTLDGLHGDWRRFTQLVLVDQASQVLRGADHWRGAADASLAFALARDEQTLYVAVELHDDVLVRSRQHAATDDAVLLTLAVATTPGHLAGVEFSLQPGEPGSYAGAVRRLGRGGGPVAGASIVEAPMREGGGLYLEASIPLRALPPGFVDHLATLRGRVAYQDNDNPAANAPESLLASGPGDGEHLDALPGATGAEVSDVAGMITAFREAQHLTAVQPLLDQAVNLAGDAALERVQVYPGFLLAAGPGISGGTRYAYISLPTTAREDYAETALRDVTGDGRPEVLIRSWLAERGGLRREVLFVYGSVGGDDHVERLFAAELGRQLGGNRSSSRATWEGRNGLRVTFASSEGFSPANYPRDVDPEVIPALTAWSPNRAVVYRWNENNRRFDVERSEPNPSAAGASPPVANAPPPQPPAPPPPLPVGGPDTVLAQYRHTRGLAADAAPRFTAIANVSGDQTPERVSVFGRDLVVYGPSFMQGRSFYYLQLPAETDAEVLGLELADVTGDGRAEALVRLERTAPMQVRGQQVQLTRELLYVYSLDEGHRGRVFGAEVRRRLGAEQIANQLRPVRAGANSELTIAPGVAAGWTAASYPFHDVPLPGIASLLLPWETPQPVTYRWNGTSLAR